MYDAILSLPLFKGVSAKDVSKFIEKSKLDFRTYHAGTRICDVNDQLERVGFILHGRVKVTTSLRDDSVTVIQSLGEGLWLQPELLFGYQREVGSTYDCETKVGMLWLSKDQLFDLINKNNLCRWNFLNYLCYKAQCRRSCAEGLMFGSELEQWLSVVLPGVTERRALSVKIVVAVEVLAEMLHIDEKTLRSQILRLSRRKKLSYCRGVMCIYNRRDYF